MALRRSNYHRSGRRSALLLGVAATAILASVPAATAGNVTWIGGAGNLLWDNAGNWQPGVAPSSADTVTISGGIKNVVRATLSGTDTAATLNIGGNGEPVKTTLVQTQGAGTLTVDALNLNSGGWLQILAGGHGATPGLAVGTLNIAANGLLDILSNTVTVSNGFTLAGTAQGPGTLISNATVYQTDGKEGVDLLKAPSYFISGGKTSTGEIDFTTAFDLSGAGRVPDNTTVLVGGAGSTMEQSGTTTMYGVVSGISSYTQSGGDMGGTVTALSYDLSGGNIDSTGVVNFSDVFTLSDTGVVEAGAQVVGTEASIVSQTGGMMSGTVFATNYASRAARSRAAVGWRTTTPAPRISTPATKSRSLWAMR